MVAKEVCNNRLNRQLGREFSRIQCIIKACVLDEFPYLWTIKYTCLKFLYVFLLKLLMEKSKSSTFSVQCLTKFFMRPSLLWRGGRNILLGSTRGWDRTLCDPGFNPCLDGHSYLTSCWSLAWLSHKHRNHGCFV